MTPFVTTDMIEEYGYIDKDGIKRLLLHLGSWLADYIVTWETFDQASGNKVKHAEHVADMIDRVCRMYDIEPLAIVSLIQKEQSAVERQTPPTQRAMDWLCGYGCPETGGRMDKFKGMKNQIENATKALRRYDDWDAIKKFPTNDIMLYDNMKILERCDRVTRKNGKAYIRAENVAEAKAFLYNPRIEGVENHGRIWRKYFELCKQLNLITE